MGLIIVHIQILCVALKGLPVEVFLFFSFLFFLQKFKGALEALD